MVMGIGKKSVPQQQQAIHAGEAYEIWQHLVMRYDTQELAIVFHNFVNDMDFKTLLSWGLSVLDKEVSTLETEMNRLGIPLPKRPPKSINTPANSEIFRDETMFRSIYMMVQLFLYQLQRTGMIMLEPRLRDMFIQMQKTEIDLYAKLVKYGKLKGWLHTPPKYNG
jgi:hypothetical protein